MDLLVIQLKAAIRRILETKGVRARVLDKVNRYGEVVIGVILERPAPALPVAGVSEREGADTSADAGPGAETGAVNASDTSSIGAAREGEDTTP